MIDMVDYQKMYKIMFRAAGQAINILIEAQRECEELYISAPESRLTLLDQTPDEDEE